MHFNVQLSTNHKFNHSTLDRKRGLEYIVPIQALTIISSCVHILSGRLHLHDANGGTSHEQLPMAN